ncbi:MAG: ribonuclease P protein component [Paramuribaculum sp.]|nr:ribonuclease P protein component [Paramuribaculum sp.]
MTGNRLYKKERLCGKTAIDALFLPGSPRESVMAYPWRAVWRVNDSRAVSNPRFLISVPKKRLRHAVDRVLMRRRCREAYRLSRNLIPADCWVDIAFVYVGSGLTPYSDAERSVVKILTKITSKLNPEPLDGDE